MANKVVKRRKISKPKKEAKNFTGSIVEKTEMVPIGDLNRYHKNPNIGDPEKTAESLKGNGQFRSIVVNRGTHTGRPNEILAGNHTYMGAKKLGWSKIQVDWVDVSETHAKKIVIADNGSRDGSKYDESILTELLDEIQTDAGSLIGTTFTDEMLGGLMSKIGDDEDNSSVNKIEDAPDQMDGVGDLNNYIYFPSDLDYEIPELLEDMIPDTPPKNMEVWGGHEIDGKNIIGEEKWAETSWLAMWHAGSRGINWANAIPYFYTDDFHFEPIFNDPAKNTKKILNLGIKTTFMPNYTIFEKMPTALWVYSAYRSYFVGRYFQEAGLKVIPDIQTGMEDAVLDLSLIGIPQGVGVVATQCQMHKGDKSGIRKKARLLKEAEDRLGFKNIVVYGHTDADEVVERADFDCNVIRVAPRTAKRRQYLNSGSTINSQKV